MAIFAWTLLILLFLSLLVIVFVGPTLTPEQRAEATGSSRLVPQVQCPHCKVVGQVRARERTVKVGVSGGKATAAILTGGLSLAVTGLSRKAGQTELSCQNCKLTWTI